MVKELRLAAKVSKNIYQVTRNISDSPRAKELTKAVGYFITKDLMPTSVVQGDGFHKLIERLDFCYQLPSHKTFSDRVIPTMYNSVKDSKVLPGLKEAKYISLTSDYCWTSRINQSYISITTRFLKVKSNCVEKQGIT